MFEETHSLADIFRGDFTYYLLIALPILFICSSNPVLASSEFNVQRMSQFDVNGVPHGCRASAINLEAKSLYTWNSPRHCVVAKFQDITIDQFHQIRQKAGGLIVILPEDVASLSLEEKERLYLLEQAMLSQVSSIPVYFSTYNSDLEKVINDITTATDGTQNGGSGKTRGSALSELLASISANGYQIVVSGSSHTANKQSKIPIVQGELAPHKNLKATDGDNLPLIILSAHLNTFGLYNEYPSNADAAVLLTIAELFSKLHSTVNAVPKYRLMFLLSESGHLLNYQGAKKWLDENVQLQNVDFILCLDTISQPISVDEAALYMHVSKPPKEGTAMSTFYKQLKSVATRFGNLTVDGVHKKINLADVQLAWEHERFSMKRLPAFTLASIKTHKEPIRTTVFKGGEAEIIGNTQKNVKIVAETLARYVYNVNDGEIFAGSLDISANLIKSWIQVKSALQNNDLKNGFEKYLKNVKIVFDKPDPRDPDFMFYDGQDAVLNVYRVKPAVFDLFLTTLIAVYLTAVYLIIQFFPQFYTVVCNMTKKQAMEQKQLLNQSKNNY